MKKYFWLIASLAICSSMNAQNEASSLLFEFKDGNTQSISANNLTITIAEGDFVADNGQQTIKVPISSLNKFYFSDVNGILDIIQDEDQNVEAFNAAGQSMGTYSSLDECRKSLPAGIYVIKNSVASYKIVIR